MSGAGTGNLLPKDMTLGIVGGMGHTSTIHYYANVVGLYQDRLNAVRNADFPRICIEGIGGADNVETLEDGWLVADLMHAIERLRVGGADLIGVPCNTAHSVFRGRPESETRGVLDIVDVTVARVAELNPHAAILLGTQRLIASRMYQSHRLMPDPGLFRLPDRLGQAELDGIILRVNAGDQASMHLSTIMSLISSVADRDAHVVLACTELSDFRKPLTDLGYIVSDSLTLLSEATFNKLQDLRSAR